VSTTLPKLDSSHLESNDVKSPRWDFSDPSSPPGGTRREWKEENAETRIEPAGHGDDGAGVHHGRHDGALSPMRLTFDIPRIPRIPPENISREEVAPSGGQPVG